MIYTYDGKEYKINIIIKNIKNTYLRVDENLNINITTNRYTRKSDIISLIENNKDKINNMINSNESKIDEFSTYYLGKKYDIIYINGYFYVDNENLKIYVADKKQLDKFLSKSCKDIFNERLLYCYQLMKNEGICFPKLRIRKMKTRWGVCNASREVVTLNYYLIEKTIEEIDYVIVHELSHFIHFNHSSAFWNLVSKYVPNYKLIRKKMR